MTTHLPISRVKTIMRSTADVETVSKESAEVLTRAAELFIKSLASEGYKDTNDKKRLEYKNLASVVHNSDRYEFLREIMPKKITVRQYRELMARKQQKLNNSTNPSAAGKDSSSSSSSSSSTSSTTSDSSSSSSDDESDTSNDKSSLVKK